MTVRRRLLSALLAGILVVLAAACGGPSGGPVLTVGASADRQNTLLANVYAAGLRYYGTPARVEVGGDPLAELDAGKASVATGFTGRLLQRFIPGSAARSPESVYRAMVGALPEGLAAADYAVAAEDKPALAVTDAIATEWGSRELAALERRCSTVRIGAVTGTQHPDRIGDCILRPAGDFGTTAMLFDALDAAAITAVWMTTAQAGLPDGVVVLADRKPNLIAAQNVVALYRRNELDKMQLRAINEIAGVLDTASLVEMSGKVADGADPRAVAEEWLADNPLGRG